MNYEKALAYLPGGSNKPDVEKAITMMRAAARRGCPFSRSWLDDNESQYCDDYGEIKSEWKRKKPTPVKNPPKDRTKDRTPASDPSHYRWKTERKEVFIHEPTYYEDLYCGVIERNAASFSTLFALGNCGDHMACYYLGIFLEKVATGPRTVSSSTSWQSSCAATRTPMSAYRSAWGGTRTSWMMGGCWASWMITEKGFTRVP